MSPKALSKTQTMPVPIADARTLPQSPRPHNIPTPAEIAQLLYSRSLALSVQKPGAYFVAILSTTDGRRVAIGSGETPIEAIYSAVEDYATRRR